LPTANGFIHSRIFLLWRWKRHVPSKRRFMQGLHGTISQKTALFIATAVKTSNPTLYYPYFYPQRSYIVITVTTKSGSISIWLCTYDVMQTIYKRTQWLVLPKHFLILTQRTECNYMYYLAMQIAAENSIGAKLVSKRKQWSVQTRWLIGLYALSLTVRRWMF
jgi:hypothetical protein